MSRKWSDRSGLEIDGVLNDFADLEADVFAPAMSGAGLEALMKFHAN
jgi:hypothetical protein